MPENDVYVRKDVFDARMDRLEILIEKNGTELKAYIDNSINSLRNELKGDIQGLRTETNASIGELKNDIQQVRTDLTGEIQTLRNETNASISELKGDIQQVRSDLTGEFQTLRNETQASISELKGDIQQVRADLTGEFQELKAEVKVLEGRVDNMVHVVNWGVGSFGVILAAAIFVPMIMSFLKKLFAPSVTIEEVRQVMDEDKQAMNENIRHVISEEIEQVLDVAISRRLADFALEHGGK